MIPAKSSLARLLPFWSYVTVFKFGAALHYSLLSVLGTQVMSPWAVGLAVGGAALLQLVLDVPAGWLLDRLGYVRVLRWSTLAFILATLALVVGLNRLTFGLTLLFSTVGWLFYGPGTNAYVLAHAPKAAAGKWLGFFHAAASAGVVLATVGLGIVVKWSPRGIGLVLTALIAAALAAIWLTASDAPSVHDEKKVARHEYYVRRRYLEEVLGQLRQLRLPGLLLLFQNLTSALFYGAIWFAVPLVMAHGSQPGLLGISLSVFDLAVVVLGTWLGKLADRLDQRRLVLAGLLVFALAGTLLGFNLNLWFLALGFVATAGDEMSSVSLWAWLDRLDEKHEHDGVLNGAAALFDDLGWTLGPIAAGLLYVAAGPAWTICLAALPIFALWIVAGVLMLRRPDAVGSGTRHAPPHRPRHKK